MSWLALWVWMRRWAYLHRKPVRVRVGRHGNRQECQTWVLALPDRPSRLPLSPRCWLGGGPLHVQTPPSPPDAASREEGSKEW